MTKKTIKTLSEADYEGRMRKILSDIFPNFKKAKLTQQETFSINIGRRNIKTTKDLPNIDNEKAKVYAIYDILFSIGDKNVILFELKKEDAIISSENINQALSYGRLINPMPPITVIAGKDVHIYDTFTRKKLERNSIDEDLVCHLIENSAELAKTDLEEAISVLLNRDPLIFSSIINAISDENFKAITGKIHDLQKPISDDFLITRAISEQIYKHSEIDNLIVLIGAAFSGKTNVLYDIFKKHKNDNTAILYLDLEDFKYSIFRKLADSFTQELGFYVNKDKVTEWLNISIRGMDNFKLIFLFDNYKDDLPNKIKSDVNQLITLTKNTKHSIILSIDEINYNRISTKPYRNYNTLFGEAKLFKVEELNTDEYYEMLDLLFRKCKASIQHGGQITTEYRIPRIIRMVASILTEDNPIVQDGQCTMLPSMPNIGLLNSVCENFLKSALGKKERELLKKISELYIDFEPVLKKKASLKLTLMAEGALPKALVKNKFNKEEYKHLLKSGLLVEKHINDSTSILIPKTPELLSFYGIKKITQVITLIQKETNNIKKTTELFINLCHLFQFSDIVGVGVLLELNNKKYYGLFSDLTNELLKDSYKKSELSDGMILRLYIPNHGFMNLNLDDIPKEERGHFLSDNLPYLILSQMLAMPVGTNQDIENRINDYDTHLRLLWKVGSYEGMLSRTEIRELDKMTEFEFYDIKDVGTIVCGKMGIIEPIVQSIQDNFLIIPDEIERLYRGAIKEKKILLVWRIYLAIRGLKDNADENIAQKSVKFLTEFKLFFSEWMAEILTSDIEDEEEKKKRKDELKNIEI